MMIPEDETEGGSENWDLDFSAVMIMALSSS